jgi:hypothetical protein
VTVESASAGAIVPVVNAGVITVARYSGLESATGSTGYARWQVSSDSTVTGATIFLDQAFEKFTPTLVRSLRSHELGHALGYNHGSTAPSVMDPDQYLLPTDFDRQAASIAFQRPPGNKSPDTDPTLFSINSLLSLHGAPGTWNAGIR